MKKLILLTVVVLAATTCFSQTKRIAHRSHSGSDKNFSIHHAGNFGLPSDYPERKKKDSLKSVPVKKDSLPKTLPVDSMVTDTRKIVGSQQLLVSGAFYYRTLQRFL